MENGRRASTTTDVIQYLVMCGLKAPQVQPLVEFTRVAERKQGYYLSDKRIDGALQSLIFHESAAEHSIIYEPQVIHGLLQTPQYARAIMTAINPDADEEWIAGVVRTRTERRRILTLPNPARFTFYIHEHALRLQVGSDEILHEQLLHLVLITALDNVTVRIVPKASGARSALSGAFRLMKFQEHPPIVYLDHLGGSGLILEEPDHVRGYQELVPVLADIALDKEQSREFAAELADAYDRGSHQRVPDVLAEEQFQRRVGIELCGGGVAEEQLQRRVGVRLRGSWVADPPTPIYE
jgi:hypothetical protein